MVATIISIKVCTKLLRKRGKNGVKPVYPLCSRLPWVSIRKAEIVPRISRKLTQIANFRVWFEAEKAVEWTL